jgi:hypothetical protein
MESIRKPVIWEGTLELSKQLFHVEAVYVRAVKGNSRIDSINCFHYQPAYFKDFIITDPETREEVQLSPWTISKLQEDLKEQIELGGTADRLVEMMA